MTPVDLGPWMQWGALGVLALVLVGLGRIGLKMVNKVNEVADVLLKRALAAFDRFDVALDHITEGIAANEGFAKERHQQLAGSIALQFSDQQVRAEARQTAILLYIEESAKETRHRTANFIQAIAPHLASEIESSRIQGELTSKHRPLPQKPKE